MVPPRHLFPWIVLSWCLFLLPTFQTGPLRNSSALHAPLIGVSTVLSVLLAAKIWMGVRNGATNEPLCLLCILVFQALALAAYPTQSGTAVQSNYLWNSILLQAGTLVGMFADLQSIVKSITILVGIESIYAVIKLVFDDDAFLSGTVTRATGTFENPTPLYFVIGFGLVTAVSMMSDRQNRLHSSFAWVIALASGLLFTWERGGVVAATIASLYLIKPTVKKEKWLPVVIVCLLAVSMVMARRSWGSTNFKSAQVSMQSRPEIWREGLELLAHHPVSGVGIGNVSLGVTRTRYGLTGTEGVAEPKNGVLQILVETGILGLAFASLLAWQCLRGLQEISPGYRRLIEALWIYTIIASSVDNPVMAMGRQTGTYLFGVLLALTTLRRWEPETMNRRLRASGVG